MLYYYTQLLYSYMADKICKLNGIGEKGFCFFIAQYKVCCNIISLLRCGEVKHRDR